MNSKGGKTVVLMIVLAILGAGGLLLGHHNGQTSAVNTVTKTATKPAPAPSSAPQAPSFNKQKYSTQLPSSLWVVTNKKHPLNPKDYAPSDLTPVGNGQYLRAAAAKALTQMLQAARQAGYSVTAASGYRSYGTQVAVYNDEVRAYGQAVADSESARPGYSEHQTGWAIDLASGGCSIEDCFGQTPGGRWVTQNAYRYGFILRYPADGQAITGYRTETWHFRYVGAELSQQMHQQGITTLEAFFDISGGDYSQ
jgi:D-alanyl-D-alanine carboxypeptidase